MAPYREIVSIVALCILAIYLGLTLFIFAFRRPSGRAGWYFITVFLLLRIAGNSLEIATATSNNQKDVGLVTAAAIISAVGLSPLLLATLFFLDHVDKFISATSKKTHYLISAMHIPVTLALVLAIVGGVQASDKISTTGKYTPNTLSKAGAVIFAVSFLCIAALAVGVFTRAKHQPIDASKTRLSLCIIATLPFLAVRLAYSLLFTFSKNRKFNLLTGDETVQLCMQVVMELVVVGMYVGCGLFFVQPSGLRCVRGTAGDDSAVEEARGDANGRSSKKVAGQRTGKVRNVMKYVPLAHWFV